MAMFVGEVDFNNMPIGIAYSRRDGNISTGLRYMFFILFLFMVVMVLMNLLNGLAITDIAKIIEESESGHQRSMIEILTELEERARSNEVVVEWFSRFVPCLYPLAQMWSFWDELKLFPSLDTQSNTIDNEHGMKGLKTIELPPPIEDESSSASIKRFSMSPKDGKKKFGTEKEIEFILKQAQNILLKNNEQKMKTPNCKRCQTNWRGKFLIINNDIFKFFNCDYPKIVKNKKL